MRPASANFRSYLRGGRRSRRSADRCAAVSLQAARTDFGAKLRAAVDSRGMAEAIGINVNRLFSIAFTLGCGLAALGGAMGYAIMPLEPMYQFKYLYDRSDRCRAHRVRQHQEFGLDRDARRYHINTAGRFLIR